MKSTLLYSVSIIVSLFWLIGCHQNFNPIVLKGPDFLQFYLMLLTGFYVSVLAANFLKIRNSKLEFYFLTGIFILGIVKLIRGLYLGKPVGYLVMILIIEIIVMLFFKPIHFKEKLK